jgi:hypothetical protein
MTFSKNGAGKLGIHMKMTVQKSIQHVSRALM